VAISRITGCSSEPRTFFVGEAFYYPQIEILTTPSICEEATGSAELVVYRQDKYYKAYWSGSDGRYSTDDFFNYLDIGRYQVDVEGSEGCFTTEEFDIAGDIIIYNGVSDNHDGLNDFFQIVCLEIFPNNNVKIFNRTGVLVFEMDQYDMNNEQRRFNGEGNRGIYFGNQELPIGTYYYIIDKRDGSEAAVGYLELKR
jgi:gliding motility-associated-like protein